MRGKQLSDRRHPRHWRNIPAYAGKTILDASLLLRFAEHPRVCGENRPCGVRRPVENGTSPRMRGKPGSGHAHAMEYRNIPAYAGKTMRTTPNNYPQTEHPRVCGENQADANRGNKAGGTSPRMRGKPRRCPRGRGRGRNIPAYAGKTLLHSPPTFFGPEHPRVRGENGGAFGLTGHFSGTSPRARGKPQADTAQVTTARNIPACAGKTGCGGRGQSGPKEHPRVRGENSKKQSVPPPCFGTSPRARGKLAEFEEIPTADRNIPACAGKTGMVTPNRVVRPEHPRVRGENMVAPPMGPLHGGTSPRARGKRRAATTVPGAGGNIPACAGKTAGTRKVALYRGENL